jgi:hypothetical protein
MTFNEFQLSINKSTPPKELSPLLKSLWFDAKGNWEHAHEIAQQNEDPESCLIHAYLHRKEGDVVNAGYWYRKAKHTIPEISIEDEWASLATRFLNGLNK